MTSARRLIPALLVAGLLAGCGTGDVDAAQDRIDGAQEKLDRATDAARDPAAAARREADRKLEDAVSPDNQP